MLSLFVSLLSVATAPQQAASAPVDAMPRAVDVVTLVDEIDAGTGGLAIDAKGRLYTADFGWRLGGGGKGGDKVFRVDPTGKVELFCREMRGASGNTFGADGFLYQSSIGGNFVSKVAPDGKVTVVAREGFKNPVGIARDAEGNLFVNNCGAGSIAKVSPDGSVTTFCKSPLLKCPNGIVLAPDGNFYVACFMSGDVVKVTPEGEASKLATLPGNNNGHLAYHEGALYVVARTDCRIYRVTLDGKATVFVGSGKRGKKDGKPLEASLSLPNDLCFSPDGRFLYINETSPIEGDPRVLGPTRIRRVTIRPYRPKASIEDVRWIAGSWRGEAMGGSFQETWNPPLAGSMVGMFKLAKKGEVSFYELLTIVPDGASLTLRLKHFGSRLEGWEAVDEFVEFPLVSVREGEAVFDGLSFRRVNANEMHIDLRLTEKGAADAKHLRFECRRDSDVGEKR